MVLSSVVFISAFVLLFPFVIVYGAGSLISSSRKWTCAVVAFDFDFDLNLAVILGAVVVGVDSCSGPFA